MISFHGSNVEVKQPALRYSRRSLDFGAGFYTTTDFSQSEKWAKRITNVRQFGKPVISVYEIRDKDLDQLAILNFGSADISWLKLVVKFRTELNFECNYDIITGPVANDRTVDVLNQYIAGTYDDDIALRLLLPMHFKDQWTLKTEKAISLLSWKELIVL